MTKAHSYISDHFPKYVMGVSKKMFDVLSKETCTYKSVLFIENLMEIN